MSRNRIVSTYGTYAPIYDYLFGASLAPGRRALVQAVRALQPRSILEVGVGTGLTLDGYPPSAAVHGIDVSEAMLAKAQRRMQHLAGRDIRLTSMDAEAMAFADGSFDCVTLPYVLSVTPNPPRMVAEVRRVCRKGGTILVLNHFSGDRVWRGLESVLRGFSGRIGFRTDFAYSEHVAAYDWEIQSIRKVNWLGLSRLIAIRN